MGEAADVHSWQLGSGAVTQGAEHKGKPGTSLPFSTDNRQDRSKTAFPKNSAVVSAPQPKTPVN